MKLDDEELKNEQTSLKKLINLLTCNYKNVWKINGTGIVWCKYVIPCVRK